MMDPKFGHVGGPSRCNEYKLIDVKEMKYTSKDVDEQGRLQPRGEILVRGSNVIPAYYKNDEKTAEAIDSDGWLHSGDIGMILPDSHALKIIDRRKNIFKLNQGEYIAPEKLENCFKLNKYVGDIFVYGDSMKSCLVAIINLDPSELKSLRAETKKNDATLEELCRSPEAKKFILDELNKVALSSKLKGFEKIRDIYIDHVPFGDKGLVTTTFKIKRNEAKEEYIQEINKLYEKLT